MENFVSAKMAWKLKEANYPQPQPKAGQYWYFDEANTFDVVFAVGETQIGAFTLKNGRKFDIEKKHFADQYAYAPTFLELANEIGGNIEFFQGWVRCSGHLEGITESRMASSGGCDLLASIWLRKKQKEG